jgi:hypothetical protein
MKCPECQFENREDAKFCKECGTNLELACSDCGTVYEMGSKFCDECGLSLAQESQIEKPDPTSEGERKHVTVLFAVRETFPRKRLYRSRSIQQSRKYT